MIFGRYLSVPFFCNSALAQMTTSSAVTASAHLPALRCKLIGEPLCQSPLLTFGHVGDLPRGVSGESEVILFPDALVLIRCRLRRRVLPRTPLTRAAPVFPDIRGTVIIVRGRINRVRRISVVELNHQRGLVPRGGGVQLLDVRGLEVKPLQRLFLGHGIVAKPEKPSSSSPPPALSSSLSRSPPEIFGFGIHGFLAHSLLLSGIFTRLRPRNSLTPSYR